MKKAGMLSDMDAGNSEFSLVPEPQNSYDNGLEYNNRNNKEKSFRGLEEPA